MGRESRVDIDMLLDNNLLGNAHPEYDDTAVVEAYKKNDPSNLSEKDKFVYKTAKKVIEDVITKDMSDYEKELAIYNWQYSYIHYNNDAFVDVAEFTAAPEENNRDKAEKTNSPKNNTNNGESRNKNNNATQETDIDAEKDEIAKSDPYGENYDYEPYGVLKFHEAICVGNATTFKLFMDMLDIPCKLVHSVEEGEHCWNLVKIDGDWYHTDITFDGGEFKPAYTNFNVTDNFKIGDYPWDTTKFPAAKATKYNYAAKNAISVPDIYSLPKAIKKAMDEDTIYLYISVDEKNTINSDSLSEIESRLSSIFPSGTFYSQEINLSEDEVYYMLQIIKDVGTLKDKDDDYKGDSENVTIDYDKLNNEFDNVFESVG